MAGLCEGGNEPPGSLKARTDMVRKCSEGGVSYRRGFRLSKVGIIVDPTIRFEVGCHQSAEVHLEKKSIYEPTVNYFKLNYALIHVEVFGLLIGARGTIPAFFEEFRRQFALPTSLRDDIVIIVFIQPHCDEEVKIEEHDAWEHTSNVEPTQSLEDQKQQDCAPRDDPADLKCEICGITFTLPLSLECAVSSTQKFLVQQHITTSKHQANKQLNSKQRQLFLTQPTTSNVRSEFNIDLCRSLISADIPLYKLKNKVFREFLEKYTQHTIPDESTLRKTYAPSIYDETIQKIRDEIKDSSIWVSIDETPDKEGRLVGNVVIGLLSEQYSERILLHCDVLEKCNNKTIVKLFNEAMGILWPKGIMYDNVLFFISDAAPYMVKAGQALSVVYPKLTHFTCVAHAFHRVAEVVRDNFLK
ncbi:hypothetical protein ANN_27529 [Periplaneta americana]|uniref:DUF659 domain-containing protein n=1 Tax=Periplaneta americana TaxID=6978 RepID=A0ABQ8RW45_PERAM|nr:hypothetical protein ANN_27529 [Periplaneta americana]